MSALQVLLETCFHSLQAILMMSLVNVLFKDVCMLMQKCYSQRFAMFFCEDDILLADLISSLSDSVGYLCGEKSDFEKRHNFFN